MKTVADTFPSLFSGEVQKLTYSSEEEVNFYFYVENDTDAIPYAFENNWSYIVQATRYSGYIYKCSDSVVYFRFRERDGRTKELVVVNHLGRHSIDCIVHIAEKALTLGIGTLIKNVDIKHLEDFKKRGFAETTVSWSKYSFRDDNTHPLNISLTKDVAELSTHSVRASTRTAIRKIHRERKIIVRRYNSSIETAARNLMEEYASYMESKGVEQMSEVVDAHVFIFDPNIKNKIHLAFFEDGALLAVCYFTVTKKTLFWSATINQNQSNIMRYILWRSLDYMRDEGIDLPQYFSLQGSETEGQNAWKKSFRPVIVLNKTHVSNNR